VHPRAPLPPLLSHRQLLPVALRSPLTQSGIRGSSPASHSAPKTRLFRPPSIFPCLRFCTSALQLLLQTDPTETSPRSVPDGSGIRAPLPLRRYTTLRTPLRARAPFAHSARRHACSQLAARSGCSGSRRGSL